MQFEYNLCAEWPELHKEIAPGVTRVAVLRDPATPTGVGQFAVIQSAAPSLGVEVIPINVRDAPEVERAVTAFARTIADAHSFLQCGRARRPLRKPHNAKRPARRRATSVARAVVRNCRNGAAPGTARTVAGAEAVAAAAAGIRLSGQEAPPQLC